MKRLAMWVVLAAALFGAARAAAEEYFQQSVRYAIHCRLDTKTHMLTGTERIVYTNNSPDTLSKLYLHLYPNAFRSKQTALMKDYARRFNKTFFDLPEKHRGYLDLFDLKVNDVDAAPARSVSEHGRGRMADRTRANTARGGRSSLAPAKGRARPPRSLTRAARC